MFRSQYVVRCYDRKLKRDMYVSATPDCVRMPTCGQLDYWEMMRVAARTEDRYVSWVARYTDKPMMYFATQAEAVQMVRDMHAMGLRDTERWAVTIFT